MNIHRAIAAYYREGSGEHHRYRSWEHCYAYFRAARRRGIAQERDAAALQLAFYLASWGMYRGSSFLLQHAYTVHRGAVDVIAEARYGRLWQADVGAHPSDTELIPMIQELSEGIRRSYAAFVPTSVTGQPTDTLVTKVLLGTFGCLPACDRYFVDGFKGAGFSYSCLNRKFIERVLGFCRDHEHQLRTEQASIMRRDGVHYPFMKLVDMCFWQLGFERDGR